MISISRPSFHFHVMDEVPNAFAYRGRRLLLTYHQRNQHIPDDQLFELIPHIRVKPVSLQHPVCIIGAGMAGLYTAMILDSLGIPYQIIEANTQARVGGRLYTHHFPGGGLYDYCVSKVSLHFTLSFDLRLGIWSHAVPGHALYEADL